MFPKLLTGKQLVENGTKKTGFNLPPKSSKLTIPSGSLEEKAEIENGLKIKERLIADQRIEKKNTLTQAEWDCDLKKAFVTNKKGNYWNYIGHYENSKTYLYPEEVLFLMETNNLLLIFGGVIVSIQQAYSLVLNSSISLNEYRVYASLMKDGYRLIRHEMERFSSHSDKEENYNDLRFKNAIIEDFVSNTIEHEKRNRNCCKKCHHYIKKFSRSNKNKYEIISNELCTTINCYQKDVIEIKAPNDDLIPNSIRPTKNQYSVDLKKISCKNIDYKSIVSSNANISFFEGSLVTNLIQNNSFFFNHIYKSIENQDLNTPQCSKISSTSDGFFQQNNNAAVFKYENLHKYKILLMNLRSVLQNGTLQKGERKEKICSIMDDYNHLFNKKYSINEDIFLSSAMNSTPDSHQETSSNLLNLHSIDMPENAENITYKRKRKLDNSTMKKSESSKRSICTVFNEPNIDYSQINNEENNWYNKEEWSSNLKQNSCTCTNFLKSSRGILSIAKKFSIDQDNGPQCWKEVKEFFFSKNEGIDMKELDYEKECAIKVDKIKPIVRPQDCVTVKSVLDRLQVVNFEDVQSNTENNLKIHYDVYMPNVKIIKKENMQLPAYCLAIKNLDSKVFTSDNLNRIRTVLPKKVKLLIAIVSHDSIFFLQMENINLPTIFECTDDTS